MTATLPVPGTAARDYIARTYCGRAGRPGPSSPLAVVAAAASPVAAAAGKMTCPKCGAVAPEPPRTSTRHTHLACPGCGAGNLLPPLAGQTWLPAGGAVTPTVDSAARAYVAATYGRRAAVARA